MKKFAIILTALIAAGCSGGKGGADAAASASADATATDSAAVATETPTEKPLTAQSCIDDNKGLGTGTRGEVTKDCLISACDQGDKKSCEMTKSFGGDGGPEADNAPPEDEEQDSAAK